ncbi:MAG: hypothetical protein AVDCRST_MAG79-2998, partial [uncultured Thermoleophilia bacterium]
VDASGRGLLVADDPRGGRPRGQLRRHAADLGRRAVRLSGREGAGPHHGDPDRRGEPAVGDHGVAEARPSRHEGAVLHDEVDDLGDEARVEPHGEGGRGVLGHDRAGEQHV